MRLIYTIVLFCIALFGVEINLDSKDNLSRSRKLPYFGESLFQGEFKKGSKLRYTPEYLIDIGDVISVKLWGAYNYSGELKVDSRGNIFIPKVGEYRATWSSKFKSKEGY